MYCSSTKIWSFVTKCYCIWKVGSFLFSSIDFLIHFKHNKTTQTNLAPTGLVLCHFFGVFQPKKLPLRPIVPLSLTFCGFVVFTNLSLQSNTVGTYQLAKALTTPLIIFVQSQFYGQTFSKAIKATMVCLFEIRL